MTKEEYERQQSVIRRVFDPDTGRHRLRDTVTSNEGCLHWLGRVH